MFFGHFWPLLKWAVFCEAAGTVAKIEPSLKSNHQIKISLSKSLIHTVHGKESFYFMRETQSTI